MRDLTAGSIVAHLVGMAGFIAASLVFQTLYFIVDLYFVSRLGNAAIAGVSAAGNVFFLALAASQLINIGVMALVAQAIGKKEPAEAQVFTDQALSLAVAFSAAMALIGYGFGGAAVDAVTADAASAAQGRAYLYAFLPSLIVMFPLQALVSTLRGAGVVMPTTLLQIATILLNVVLAPVLIAGWGTGVPLGVAGAGWASSIAAFAGLLGLVFLFPRVQRHLRLHLPALKPRIDAWSRLIFVGAPTSLEFLLMFTVFGVIYWVIRDFGAEAQAGFGIGARIMQMIFLPAMAIAFAAAPIAGQNYGARRYDRVRGTFRAAAAIGSAVMLALSLLCHIDPTLPARPFADDPAVLAVAGEYLRIASWGFVFNGLTMTAASLFQGMGDTRPSLLASASRLITFAAPAVWMSNVPGVSLTDFWLLGLVSIAMQCALALALLALAFRQKLGRAARAASAH